MNTDASGTLKLYVTKGAKQKKWKQTKLNFGPVDANLQRKSVDYRERSQIRETTSRIGQGSASAANQLATSKPQDILVVELSDDSGKEYEKEETTGTQPPAHFVDLPASENDEAPNTKGEETPGKKKGKKKRRKGKKKEGKDKKEIRALEDNSTPSPPNVDLSGSEDDDVTERMKPPVKPMVVSDPESDEELVTKKKKKKGKKKGKKKRRKGKKKEGKDKKEIRALEDKSTPSPPNVDLSGSEDDDVMERQKRPVKPLVFSDSESDEEQWTTAEVFGSDSISEVFVNISQGKGKEVAACGSGYGPVKKKDNNKKVKLSVEDIFTSESEDEHVEKKMKVSSAKIMSDAESDKDGGQQLQ